MGRSYQSAGVALLTLLVLSVPRPASSWGFAAHRFVVERAIALLPESIRPFFEVEEHRVFVIEHSVDPDLWRLAGFGEEAPRHFLNLDAYGADPLAELPLEYEAAVEKFGRSTVETYGLLPWRAEEIFDRLVSAFERQARGSGERAAIEVLFFSAVLAHYLADAHVPFHAVLNHDGQLTGQRGIHARFETELFNRYREQLRVRPAATAVDGSVRDLIFDTLLEGVRLAGPVLAADRAAASGSRRYDDAYFDRFFAEVRPILERRLAESAGVVAGALTAAWERAGRPALPLTPARRGRTGAPPLP